MEENRGERLRTSFADAEREKAWPNLRPRDAATLIIVDRAGVEPKVLMGRRHHGHKFMPGKFVFPGGRLERADGRVPSVTDLPVVVAEKLAARTVRRSETRGRALALTAIRETFEETGMMLGRRVEATGRRAVHPGWGPYLDAGIAPDLSRMVFIGRAITPPRRPKRFDTRFFTIDRDAVYSEEAGFVGPDKELVELAWVGLAEARTTLDLPRITAIMLEELEHRIAEGLAAELPVPFYRELNGRFLRELL